MRENFAFIIFIVFLLNASFIYLKYWAWKKYDNTIPFLALPRDYINFHKLIADEKNERKKNLYRVLLYGQYICIVGLGVFIYFDR